jgi:putative DNA primase/helicase
MNSNEKNYDFQAVFGVELWDEPVDAKAVYGDLKGWLGGFVRMLPHEVCAASLWTLHAYTIREPGQAQVCDFSPILFISSPEKSCGKSTLVELLAELTPRTLMASNISDAAMYRLIESRRPTLFLDEIDTFFGHRNEISGVLNSGCRQAGKFIRMGGKNYDVPIEMRTWGAKCISGIGTIPVTVESRCLKIRLKRKLASETVLRRNIVLSNEPTVFVDLRRKMARFIVDSEDEIQALHLPLLGELDDRTQDVWSGLFRIAKFIGDEVYAEAIAAAIKLSSVENAEKSESIELIEDIWHLFDDGLPDRVSSKNLCQRLCTLEDRPWATYQRGGLDPFKLSTLLKGFGIHTRQIKEDGRNIRRYERSMFEEVFRRYLGK